jgi:hypothetical protein
MNDPADDINFDAAFVKDSDISGAREALGKFLQGLESIGIMSHEEIADAVDSLPLPQKQAKSSPNGPSAYSVKQALEVFWIYVASYAYVNLDMNSYA